MTVAALFLAFAVSDRVDLRLTELESQIAVLQRSENWVERSKGLERINGQVKRMIARDELSTGAHFRRASGLVSAQSDWFEDRRVRYELMLVGMALGDEASRSLIGAEWDGLIVSMGRRPRIGAHTILGSSRWMLEPTMPAIVEALKSQTKMVASLDSDELQEIRKSDQASRQGDFSKMTMEQIHAMVQGDQNRRKRVRELLGSGAVRTGRDFEAASLVMQHGEAFEDYVLAHELSLCAIVKGFDQALWLVSRSYDRMLMSAGYRQRMLTQYGASGLMPYDDKDTNDRMRLALKTLGKRQAIERGKQMASGR